MENTKSTQGMLHSIINLGSLPHTEAIRITCLMYDKNTAYLKLRGRGIPLSWKQFKDVWSTAQN